MRYPELDVYELCLIMIILCLECLIYPLEGTTDPAAGQQREQMSFRRFGVTRTSGEFPPLRLQTLAIYRPWCWARPGE